MWSRRASLDALADLRFDLLVVGGGITGAGIAREAALRGLCTALAERSDFACGTSSRSTRLVHGGLRYLRQLEIRLVREALVERQRLLAMAPHLVRPLGFLFPVYRHDPDGLLALRIGLTVYDWFAGRGVPIPHRMMTPAELLACDPLVRRENLKGGALYTDSVTDDARLTLAVLRSAVSYGAVAANYLEAAGMMKEASEGFRVTLRDRLDGDQVTVYAKQVINAAGPWADAVRRLDQTSVEPLLRVTKGAHLVVRHERLPVGQAVCMRGADGRLMFAVPAGDFTYLGTTDTDYTGSLETVLADAADITYILEAANRTFAGSDLTEADIVSTWAGLRPLLRMPGDPSAVSRDYHLYTSRSGMVTVAGGKLTAFRAMASHIVDTVFPATRREKHLARSIAPLPGADLPPEAELAARVGYAVREEMAIRLADFCRRRTGLMLFAADNGRSLLDGAAALMGELLGWSEERKAGELAAVRSEIEAMFAWRRAAVAVP